MTSLATTSAAVLVSLAVSLTLAHGFAMGAFAVAATAALLIGIAFAIRPPEGLAAFGITVLLAESINYWSGLDLRYFDEAGLLVLIAVMLLVHRRRITVPSLGFTELGLAVVVFAGVTSSVGNDVPASIWLAGLALLAKGVTAFYLIRLLDLGIDEVRRLGLSILVVGIAITAIGLVQFVNIGWAEIALWLPPTGQPRGSINIVGSVFTHPAIFGWLTAYISLFAYARFAVLRDRAALIIALASNLGTLLSGRRAPVIGVIAGLIVAAVRQVTAGRHLGRAWVVLAAAAVVVVAVSVQVLGSYYATTLERYGADPKVIAEVFANEPDPERIAKLQPRVALYAGSLAIARDEFPFGAGIGRFGSQMSRESYSPVYVDYGLHRIYGLREANPRAVTDTFWPMIVAEAGVLGLLGALLFIGGIGVRLWRATGVDSNPAIRAFTLGALMVFAEAGIRSLVSPVFVAPPIAYFVYGAVAIALALESRSPRKKLPGEKSVQ